jgi:hypothetical protein
MKDEAPTATNTSATMLGEGDEMTPQGAAASLVRRARMGDQNAISIIALVRENAARGVARAKATLSAIMAYINGNPATMAGESYANSSIRNYADQFTSNTEKAAFFHGVQFGEEGRIRSFSPADHRAHAIGKTLRHTERRNAAYNAGYAIGARANALMTG